MANYSAKVDVIISGIREAKALGDSLERVQGAIARISKTPIELNVGGRGGQRDLSGVLSKQVNDLVREFVNGERKLAQAVSGLNQQVSGFAELLSQTFIKGSGDINRQDNAVKNLVNTWADANIQLDRYTTKLTELQRTALAKKGFMQLAGGQIARGVEDAGFGLQGPQLPGAIGGGMNLPQGVEKLGPRRLQGVQRALGQPGVSDAIIGAGFPMLFGGGPGAVLGGGLGGLAGGALGGGLGMALSIGLSAVGQQLDAAVVKVKRMGDAINAIDIDALRDSFIVVNSELDTTVRRLIEAGEIDKARAEIAAEVAAQTGASAQAISGVTNSTSGLFTAWDRFSSAVSTTAGILSTPLLDGITAVLNVISLAAQGANILLSLFAQAGPILERSLAPLLPFTSIFKFLADKTKDMAVNEKRGKLTAELEKETDERMQQLALMGKQDRIDQRRNRGTTAAAQIQNNELDRQSKINDLVSERDKKLREARTKYAGTDETQLAVLEKQIQVEFKLNQRLVEREALRKRERLELEQTLDVINASAQAEVNTITQRQAISQQDLSVKQSVLSTTKELGSLQQSQLQAELKYSMSLNQTSALIDKVAASRQADAEIQLQSSRLQAQASIEQARNEADMASAKAKAAEATMQELGAAGQLTELKKVELQATIDQAGIAQLGVGIAQTIASDTIRAAEAKRQQLAFAIDLERREQQVAAFAKEAAYHTERFNQAAQQSANAISNTSKVADALVQAQQTINNIEIQSLQNKLQQAATDTEREIILNNIRQLEINNARLILYGTYTQIKAELERQRIAVAMAEVKVKELESVVSLAAAQKVLTLDHIRALEAQRSALVIAQQNYATSQAVAKEQYRAADAVYNAAVNAANLKVSMQDTASAAGEFAGAMGAAAEAARATSAANRAAISGSYTTVGKVLTPVGVDIIKREEERKNLLNVDATRFGGQSTTQEDRQSALTAFRERTSTNGGTSVNPQVSITTGPVMQMDGTNYVTQRDLVSATGAAARQGANMALQMLQNNPAARRRTGVTQ